jgi:hypothetical protein
MADTKYPLITRAEDLSQTYKALTESEKLLANGFLYGLMISRKPVGTDKDRKSA